MADTGADFFRRRPVLVLAALTLAGSLPFILFPQIDLAVSRLLFVPGRGFALIHEHTLDIVRYAKQVLLVGVVVWALASLFLARSGRRRLLPRRASLYLVTSLALGPGLLVGYVLKNHWGRARPRNLVEFGGTMDFSQAWEISSQCVTNCSFVSGEAASAMWFMALVVIAPAAWRLRLSIAVLLMAATVSFARMLAGAHFLSDVLIAWLLTFTVIALCYVLFYRALRMTDDELDAWFARLRDFLGAPFRLVLGRG